MNHRGAALLAINLAALLFGSAALCGKLNISPFFIVCARSGFAALALLFSRLIQRQSIQFSEKLQGKLFLSGFALAAHWLFFFASVQMANVAIATVSFASFPLFTIFFRSLMYRKSPTIIEIIAALTILLAITILCAQQIALDPAFIPGTICGINSAALFSFFSLLSQSLNRKNSRVTVSLYQNLYVFILLLPATLLTDNLPEDQNVWITLSILGVFMTAGAHQLYFFALEHLRASTCAAFVSLEPIYAIILSQLIYQEVVSSTVILCGFGILLASTVLLRQEKAAHN